ncbi:L-serine dehydratase [Bradyrhizobium sp. USDA 4461]
MSMSALKTSITTLLERAAQRGKQTMLPIGLGDLFKVGIGPSSSHTIGPMKIASSFVRGLGAERQQRTSRIAVTAFGSLAWTGKGHRTDVAVLLGLSGHLPDQLEPDETDSILAEIRSSGSIVLPNDTAIEFVEARDLVFDKQTVYDRHPNALLLQAFDKGREIIASEVWYSVGGGFIERDGDSGASKVQTFAFGFDYRSADELLAICRANVCAIADVAFINELARRDEPSTVQLLDTLIQVMMACVDRGLDRDGELPGSLKVPRRAKKLFQRLRSAALANQHSPSEAFEYVSAFAIAVNEENASGGRVVTAPTNGAAGVLPAVLRYYRDFCDGSDVDGMRTFLLTATAIGSIIKHNASISGAEVGCQGEVGSAAAMAAAGLAAALGGTNEQIENAAEIAMEHHLGMTCDPVAGLVQIPCIERNAFGAIKSINAALLALAGDGTHKVSLDHVIETMRQTGADMHDKYRETSRGGLAVNVPEC